MLDKPLGSPPGGDMFFVRLGSLVFRLDSKPNALSFGSESLSSGLYSVYLVVISDGFLFIKER